MNSIKVLIVDDEPLARKKISHFLSARSETFIMKEAANGLEALEKISLFEPDLIFLDVEMPEVSGLELLSQLEKRSAKIIFQTAYDKFALRAFEANACDYLLKPFTRERFYQALDRALGEAAFQEKFNHLENTIQKEGHWLRNMIAKQGDRFVVVHDKDIICFISQEHCTTLHTLSGEFVCDLSLSHLEKRLDPKDFIRLHRNNIVRISAVKSIGTRASEDSVVLTNGRSLPVSRPNQKLLKKLFFRL